MGWIGGAVGIVGIIVGVIGITLFWRIRLEAKDMTSQLRYINTHKTNKEITVGMPDRALQELAMSVNELIMDKKTSGQSYIRMEHSLREAIANVSHDLRTPLTSILGYIQLIEGKLQRHQDIECNTSIDMPNSEKNVLLSKQSKESGSGNRLMIEEGDKLWSYLQTIRGRAEALNVLVESFYELSKLSSSETRLKAEEVHIDRIICELMAGFYQSFVDKNLELKISIPENLPSISGEVKSVERVLMNLIQNTLRYAKKKVELKVEKQENFVVLILSNESGDVKEEDLPYLYDRFFMTSRVRSGEGTGIGLAVVKKLMGLMGGEAGAELIEDRLCFVLKWHKWKK